MTDMITYSTAVLTAIVDFLLSEPITYLWCMILFAILVKIVMGLLHSRF